MRSSVLALLAALLLVPAALSAQQIRGVVVDDSTGTPVPGVTVELLNPDSTVHTSAESSGNGWFQLVISAEGQYYLRTSHRWFGGGQMHPVSVGSSEVLTVVLSVSAGAIPLEPLRVTARSFDRLSGFRERSQRQGTGRYITREQVERRLAAPLSHLLQLTPGLRVETIRDASGLSTRAVLMRSYGELCMPAIFLDGLRMHQDMASDIDDLIATDLVEGVEIYTTYVSAPAEFMLPHNECGVIAVWTRPAAHRPFTWTRVGIGVALGVLILLLSR